MRKDTYQSELVSVSRASEAPVLPVEKLPIVTSVAWKDHEKTLITNDRKFRPVLPRSACVSVGDKIERRGGAMFVVSKSGSRHQIWPPYSKADAIKVCDRKFELVAKEITEKLEFQAYESLSRLHYRNKAKHGRTAILVLRSYDPDLPPVLGYLELATPFYFNKPRTRLVDTRFSFRDAKWSSWDSVAIKHHLGLFVRIARCVVAPEFRGLGLSTILIKHARQFARSRWQTGGTRPIFVEISADMLKFVPFAEKAGLHYIGETEGNLARVATDMEYLTRNAKRVRAKEIVQEEACGIVDQQVRRMEQSLAVMRAEGLGRKEFLRRLRGITETRVIRDYSLYSQIVSLPKPSYMGGLYAHVDKFISRRCKALSIGTRPRPRVVPIDKITSSIRFEKVTADFVSRGKQNAKTNKIHHAFGIAPEQMISSVIRSLDATVMPGQIVLVTGPSGAGKSLLLDLIRKKTRKGLVVGGAIHLPQNARIGAFQPLDKNRSLVEIFGENDVAVGLDLLTRVGLSDAYLFLRKFEQLSAGQQHRAMLADLVRRNVNVALIDEFCASLDSVTATIVAHGIRKLAKQLGITVFAAAAHCDIFLQALKPDKVIFLSSYGEASVASGEYFLRVRKNRNGSHPATAGKC